MLGKWNGLQLSKSLRSSPIDSWKIWLFSAAHQLIGWALLGPKLSTLWARPRGSVQGVRTLEVKADDLSFILVNLSIKQFIGELHRLCDVTGKHFHMLTITKQAWWRQQSFINDSHEKNKGSRCKDLWLHCQTFYIQATFWAFGVTNIPSIITVALSNTFTVEYLKWSSYLQLFFFFFLTVKWNKLTPRIICG